MKQLSTMANNALINARRAKECKQYGQARSYYLTILREDPEHWEAFFYSTFCGVINADISQAAKYISNCLKMVLKDIKKLEDTAEQNKAIEQISTDLFNYALISQIEVINGYKKYTQEVWDKTSKVIGPILGTEGHNYRILENMDVIANRYIFDIIDMLILLGNELVSEFGKSEVTQPINIKCHEIAFKMAPCQYYADKLKQVNPYSPELLKYENRGILKKFWERQNPMERMVLGCGGAMIAITLFMAILVLFQHYSGIMIFR